jgi:hypothetical protein
MSVFIIVMIFVCRCKEEEEKEEKDGHLYISMSRHTVEQDREASEDKGG